jgi:hypothetical protein
MLIERKRVFRDASGRRIGSPEPAKRDVDHRPPSAANIAARLAELAESARRLRPPMSSNPSAFHEDKSELARQLNKLADAVKLNLPLPA